MSLFDEIRNTLGSAITQAGERLSTLGEGHTPDADEMTDVLEKAGLVQATMAQPTEDKPRAMFHDPYAVVDWGGWRERPSALTYETLRQMSMRNTVIASIINLRSWQVSQFGVPQQGRYDKGYRIVLRDRRDKKKGMSDQEKMRASEMERMLETTGYLLPDEKPAQRDSFRAFLKKATRDVLTYDQWCFEKIRDRSGRISRFQALPSETIRPAVSDYEHMDEAEQRTRVSHVQVYDDSVIAEFSPEDIAFCIMNPRADLRVNGFGFSPIEQLVQLITAWLFGFEYNQRFFSQGSAIKGLINIKGAIPDKQLRAFRRMWYSQISGVSNAWKTPILNSDDIQWQSMHSTNREMEFSAWMDWLTKLTCAIYGIDPIEINFQYGNTGQSNSLNTPDNEKRVTESKDKGLRPLMEHITDSLNAHIIWELDPNFEFQFTGLDAKSEDQEREARIKECGNYRYIDEVRADMDDPPLPDGMGQVIANPVWFQFYTAAKAEAAQAAMGAGGVGPDGQPLDDGGGPPPTDLDDEEQLFDPNSMNASGIEGEDDEEMGLLGDGAGESEDDDGDGTPDSLDQDSSDEIPGAAAARKIHEKNEAGAAQAMKQQQAQGVPPGGPPGAPGAPGKPSPFGAKPAAPGEAADDEEDEDDDKKKPSPFEKALRAAARKNASPTDKLQKSMDDVMSLVKSARVTRTKKNGRLVIDVELPGGE